jgi:hypothetical protein
VSAAAALERELQACADEVRAGRDIAPSRRARLEGAIAAAMVADGNAETLLQRLRDLLPEDGAIAVEADTGHVRLQLWQRRAPVYPSTGE